jgi:methyl-accepting chemotaxis protein
MQLKNWTKRSVRNKLLLITGTGTVMLLTASLFDMWLAWQMSTALPPEVAAGFKTQLYYTLGLMIFAILFAFVTFLALVQKKHRGSGPPVGTRSRPSCRWRFLPAGTAHHRR